MAGMVRETRTRSVDHQRKRRCATRTFVLALLCVLYAWGISGQPGLAAASRNKPEIHGPLVYGQRPNHPFLYRIPATGSRPMRFRASGLPKGLELNSVTGIVSGAALEPGTSEVILTANNRAGSASGRLRIVIGDTLALTPPMGWSSWDLIQSEPSDRAIRAQAEAMISTGLADHGYSLIEIDDGWNMRAKETSSPQPARDRDGNMLPSERFPNMAELTEFLHHRGLKAGIYSSPGPLTCGGFEGSFGHEQQDAKQFARWGFDLLKYDWCSYQPKDRSLPELEKPYRRMGTLLASLPRDILFALCQYGDGEVWKWGRETGGHTWRVTGDLGWGPKGIYSVWDNIVADFSRPAISQWDRPGGWSDLDNLFLGNIAYVPSGEVPPNAKIDRVMPTPLTPDEQYTHMSFWCLMASPLIFGGDLTSLDAFTLSLLTNDEVIAVDQDPLGRQAKSVFQKGPQSIWAKEMADGSKAVGLFNLDDHEQNMVVHWTDLGLSGSHAVRDLWRQQDEGTFDHDFQARVTPHGVVLLRVTPAAR
jgi:alpha-galactosidase